MACNLFLSMVQCNRQPREGWQKKNRYGFQFTDIKNVTLRGGKLANHNGFSLSIVRARIDKAKGRCYRCTHIVMRFIEATARELTLGISGTSKQVMGFGQTKRRLEIE